MSLALFLGAGASVPYGMPTTNELKDVLKTVEFPFGEMLNRPEYPDVEYILPALDDITNFSESEGGKFWSIYRRDHFNEMVNKAKLAKRIVEQEIFLRYKWDTLNDSSAQNLLGRLFALAKSKKGNVTIFTTNFDTVIEEYCAKSDKDIKCINGFHPHRSRNIHVWSGDFQAGRDTRPKAFLYKLHGSLSWEKQNIDGDDTIVHKTGTRQAAFPSNDVFIRPSLNVKGETVDEDPYRTVIKEFDNKLSLFDACIVIGYSFRDRHISDKLVDFVRQGKTLVSLSPTAMVDFSKNALGQTPVESDAQNWGAKPICSLSHMGKGAVGFFYAVHGKLDEDGLSTVAQVVESRPTRHSVGSIGQADE